MEKVIIIDGNSLVFGIFDEKLKIPKHLLYAKSDGRNIYLIRKFIKKIIKLKFKIFPNYNLVVIFDEKDKITFRHKLDSKYKNKMLSSKRKKQKDYVYQQIDEIKKILKKINIPIYSNKNWEADDVIGMLILKYEEKKYKSIIFTKDKDLLQLISKKTSVAIIENNFKFNFYNRNNIWNITNGLWPNQIIDLKILIGDNSDNIKGLGLIRNKNETKIDNWKREEAIELIKKFSSIKNMLINIERISEPFKSSLLNGSEKINKNRKLVKIIKYWSLTDINFNYFKNQELNINELNLILDDLNLTKLKPILLKK